jgi:hypothetical protein
MRFDEHDDRDPRVQEYIEFALKIKSVEEAKQNLASAARSIQWMYHTFSGCDWCDECGGGSIAMAEAQYAAKHAITYLLAQGEEIKITPVCHGCFHHDATHVSSLQPGEYPSFPMCDKCGDAAGRYLGTHVYTREPIPDSDRDCGIWYVSEPGGGQ